MGWVIGVCQHVLHMDTSDDQKEANVKDPERVQKAVGSLKEARRAETAGLESLKQIVAEL